VVVALNRREGAHQQRYGSDVRKFAPVHDTHLEIDNYS
jgi:hypothetical protein